MDKILVTGSSGYIGGRFIKLYQDKYQFEKFSLLSNKIDEINFIEIDIVLHCAALVHQKTEKLYEEYSDINVKYPLELANLAKQNNTKHFIFISTIAVYGEDEENLNEQSACNPITPYGKTKLEAEKKLLELNDDNFKVSIIRPPMVYGKDAPGNIESLIKIIKKIPVLPFNHINNNRSFVYIDNLCYFIDVIIQNNKDGIFLAGDDSPISTTKLIDLIAKNLQKDLVLIKIPFFETILKSLKPTIHKRLYGSLEVDNHITKKKLNLINPYTVEEGIRLMVQPNGTSFRANGEKV